MAVKKKYPHGVVSRAQWRYLYAAGKKNPKLLKVAKMLTERNERQRPGGLKGHKIDYHSIPERKGVHVGIHTLRNSVGRGSR